MNKHKDNPFVEKFSLLCSQVSEEIKWSSSDSSEFENVPSTSEKLCCVSSKYPAKKRKRKPKVPKNISNLDITILDPCKQDKSSKNNENSNRESNSSPILGNGQYFPPYKCKLEPSSPIISSASIKSSLQCKEIKNKSPILLIKTASPKFSPKVRKKLFSVAPSKDENCPNHLLQNRSKSSNNYYDQTKSSLDCKVNKSFDNNCNIDYKKRKESQGVILHVINETDLKESSIKKDERDTFCTIEETPDMDDSIAMLKTSSIELANKVKYYFESHFSSDSISQQTISEVTTPKNSSKTSDDIEISNTVTQVASNKNTDENVNRDDTEVIVRKDKKLRYKKDGAAYRLNSLLKKQVANISLWQHERFLAENSNFVIPKGEYLAFRICKTQFKYGIYSIEVMSMNDDNYTILINKDYVTDDSVFSENIFKLYEPYRIVDFDDNSKFIINVCKFECVSMKN